MRVVVTGATGNVGTSVVRRLLAKPVLGRRSAGRAYPVLRSLAASGCHGRLLPMHPAWLDVLASVPILGTARARSELCWSPTYDAPSVVRELLDGLRHGSGGPTPPLRRREPPLPLPHRLVADAEAASRASGEPALL